MPSAPKSKSVCEPLLMWRHGQLRGQSQALLMWPDGWSFCPLPIRVLSSRLTHKTRNGLTFFPPCKFLYLSELSLPLLIVPLPSIPL